MRHGNSKYRVADYYSNNSQHIRHRPEKSFIFPNSTIEPKIWSFFDVTKRKLGKNVILECRWGNSEIERDSIPGISEIFYHLLINALDHGIESPEVRLENKKNERASIIVSAETLGDTLSFTFEDDGAGLATNKIGEKAIKIVGNSSKLHDLSRSRSRLHIPARTPSCVNSAP